MGKLVEKLRAVGQMGTGGFGFLARTQTQKPRPAALFVSVAPSDTAVAAAALQAGADGIVVSGWTPGASLSAFSAAIGSSSAVLGVSFEGEGTSPGGVLQRAREAQATFVIFGAGAAARLLFEDPDQLDLVVTVDVPRDDLGLLIIRGDNLLPVQAALLRAPLGNSDLARLTVADFARLRLARESLRFPALATLAEAPEMSNVRLLVRLGLDGLVLQGEGAPADEIGAQVKALREELERTPADDTSKGAVAIGGLMEASGQSLPPQRPSRREPQPEPEQE